MRDRMRLWGKRLLFPGLDLNTRCRYRFLPRFFREGPIDTLDAGCGNGALSYAAYRRGSRVLGVTMDLGQVQKAREYFGFLGCTGTRGRPQLSQVVESARFDSRRHQFDGEGACIGRIALRGRYSGLPGIDGAAGDERICPGNVSWFA